MRVVLSALGPIEDIRLMLALGQALRRRGHEPMLAIPPKYAENAAQSDLPMAPLPVCGAVASGNGSNGARLPEEAAVSALSEIYRKLVEVCRSADVLIGGHGDPACRMTHETLSIPYATFHEAPGGMDDSAMKARVNGPVVNECRRLAGLPPPDTSPAMPNGPAQLALDGNTESSMAAAVELIEKLANGRKAENPRIHPGTPGRGGIPPLVRSERGHDIQASFSQQRLWFLDQLAPGNSTYNMPIGLRLRGTLDTQALRRSLTELVRRHESLRTTFAMSGEVLVQKIAPTAEADFEMRDLETLPEEQRETEAVKIALTEGGQPFDPGRGPLLRIRLLKLGPQDHVLLLTVHHIVCDGWSVSILVRELGVMYEAYLKGEVPRLPEMGVQYADFADWQRALMESALLQAQMEYWRRQLQDIETLDLPIDRPRTATLSSRGARVDLQLEDELSGQLRKLCREEKSTLFMVFLAAFQLMLAKYSGSHDIAVGTAIANRTRRELEGVVGCFINSLVLRTRLASNGTLRDALSQARQTALTAYQNQYVPLERLVQELQPHRDSVRTPFFQTMIILEIIEYTPLRLRGIQSNLFGPAYDSAKFDLTLSLRDLHGKLGGELVYSPELFDAETIQRMGRHWNRVLREMAVRPGLKIDELSLLEESESLQLLREHNETIRDFPNCCVHELIEEQCRRTPERVALEFEGLRMTYRDLDRSANQLAARLRTRGAGPEDKVAIFLERGPQMLIALLAVWKAGAAYVPMDPGYPAERLAWMLEDSQAEVMISQTTLAQRLKHGLHVIDIERDPGEIEEADLNRRASPMNAAYLIYTSGSTGKPKGTEITHASLVNFLTAMQRELAVGPEDVLLAETPLSFDIAGLELYLPLCTGGRVKLLSRQESTDAFQLARRISEDVTLAQATPATWQMVLDTGWSSTREIKILCGGEALAAELAKRLTQQSPHVWNMYGPTETTVWSLMQPLRPDDERTLIGRAIANTEVCVLDENMLLLPEGIAGELHIGGAGLARGYRGRPDLTAEKFIPDPFSGTEGGRLYRTGDRVRRLSGGRLEFLGRIDQQVKIRGHRIEPGEIEAVLSECPLVRQAAVICREDRPGDKRIVAYVVAREGMEPVTAELMKFAGGRLPEHMIPGATVWLDELPMTPNRKIDRKRLPMPQVAAESYTPPRNREEEILCTVWSEVLGRERIGVTDNFFELGGHSLLAVRIVTKLRDFHRMQLPLRAVFDRPTIEGAAEWLISADPAEGKEPPLTRIRRKTAAKKPLHA